MTSKKLNLRDLRVGQLVVCTDHAEAQVRTIAEIDRFRVLIASFEGDKLCSWWTDYSLCYKPTIEQVEYTINNWGRLVSIDDLPPLLKSLADAEADEVYRLQHS